MNLLAQLRPSVAPRRRYLRRPAVRRVFPALASQRRAAQRRLPFHQVGSIAGGFASAMNNPVIHAIERVPVVGQVLQLGAGIVGALDSLFTSGQQCAPGNPGWPGCAIPGGSGAALLAAGASPAAVAEIIAAATSGGGLGGGMNIGPPKKEF